MQTEYRQAAAIDQARDNRGLSRRIGLYADFEGRVTKTC